VEKTSLQWQVFGQSVRGAAHERRGTPNQDALGWLPRSGAGSSLVAAVSDGHGGARYIRSHVGARLAVRVSTRLIHSFANRHKDAANLSLIKRTAEEWLPRAVARAWLDAVNEDLQRNPLSQLEAEALGTPRNDLDGHAIAYGATLVAVGITNAFVIYVQIGDGEILTVTDGRVLQPVPKDDRLVANETTSLCAAEAWRDFRVAFQPITQSRSSLILLATDGYSNSFRNQAGFLQAGLDISQMLRAEGAMRVRNSLEGWLRDTTKIGSGDDITVAILYPGKSKSRSHRPTSSATTRGAKR